MGEDCQNLQVYEKIHKKEKTLESIVGLLEGYTFAEVVNILDSVKWHCSTLSVVGMHVKQKGLKAIRKQKGMSGAQLSRLCGFSRQYLSSIETGKIKAGLNTWRSLAQALHCKVSDLTEDYK